MSTLIPTASTCHSLQLPPVEKDDRLNLNVRTGSAATLYNSLVFTHGGLTIGLELQDHTIPELLHIFKLRINNLKTLDIDHYISGELFYLKLIERTWVRVALSPEKAKPAPRLLHEICAINNCVYVFGGLKTSTSTGVDGNSHECKALVPCNDLWEFNLEKREWTLLHDGSGWESDPIIPQPRFLHKITAILSITFIRKSGHFGLFIAGGKDSESNPIYDNIIFDLVDKKYVSEGHAGHRPVRLRLGHAENLKSFDNVNDSGFLNINYTNSIIVNITEEIDHIYMRKAKTAIGADGAKIDDSMASAGVKDVPSGTRSTTREESLVVYAPVKINPDSETVSNPLISFKVDKKLKLGKVLKNHRPKKDSKRSQTIPYNLRYPTGGLFGKNLVIVGFLPGDFDISIFVFNKPTGRWSRLNIFCNHDYGTHRFWGGFAWQSHHKVVLLGNHLTLKTTSSIRFFSLMITVSLPITNILASFELAGNDNKRDRLLLKFSGSRDEESITDSSTNDEKITRKTTTSTSSDTDSAELGQKSSDELALYELEDEDEEEEEEDEDDDDELEDGEFKSPTISFNDYVHYAAPKTNFTTIRSVFPPAAVTLGRIALDRYGDLISDFELISANGDRIPVSLNVLMERWGRYFIDLLARGYVQAVEKFENSQMEDANDLRMSKDSDRSSTSSSYQARMKHALQSALEVDTSSKYTSHNKPTNHSKSIHMTIPVPKQKSPEKDAPQFRLPFQDSTAASSSTLLSIDKSELEVASPGKVIDDDIKMRSDDIDGVLGGPEDLTDSAPLEERPNATRVSSAIDPHSSLTFEGKTSSNATTSNANKNLPTSSMPLPTARRESTSSFASANSLFTSHLQDIPAQLPLPDEPIPAVPVSTSFRSSSRKLSGDISSPRASLIHTLTVLRNIPTSRSPRESPFASPRNSFSGPPPMSVGQELSSTNIPNLKQKDSQNLMQTLVLTSPNNKHSQLKSAFSMTGATDDSNLTKWDKDFESSGDSLSSSGSSKKYSDFKSRDSSKNSRLTEEYLDDQEDLGDPMGDTSVFDGLLNLDDMESGKFRMEPSLIPRKLYIPFSTVSVKGFCEFLYTGQVGNKWLLSPTTLDNLALSKFYKAPLLYDLISEVLFGVIGRKENYVISEGKKLKSKYFDLIKLTNTPLEDDFRFPLDEYDGLMDTVDDGYLDIALLKKASEHRKNSSLSSGTRKKSKSSTVGPKKRHSRILELSPLPAEGSDSANHAGAEVDNVQTDVDSSDSLKQISSTSDEENDFELAYLDALDGGSNIGPRSKSIFDKSQGKLSFQSKTLDYSDNDLDEEDDLAEEKLKVSTLTLEQLVSPNAPVPSDYVIDLIYEMGAITSDMKLMLRSVNAKQMSKILTQWKDELEEAIENLQAKYDMQCKEKSSHEAQADHLSTSNPPHKDSIPSNVVGSGSKSTSPSNGSSTETADRSTVPPLKPTRSTTSLLSIGSTRTEGSDKSKSSRGFPRIAGFTPFTSGKSKDPTAMAMENNKEVDKRITKLIKKDEKIRVKNERDEKLRQALQHNLEKQKKKHEEKQQHGKVQHSPTVPGFGFGGNSSSQFSHPITRTSTSDAASITSSTAKKNHGLLYNLSHPLTRTQTSFDLKMNKTGGSTSDTNSIETSKSHKQNKHSLFGKKQKSKESSPHVAEVLLQDKSPIHTLKSYTSLHSQDSKRSEATTTSHSSGKKRLHLFGSKKDKS